MSTFWWLQPGWTDELCARCGAKIHPEGDPDWGLCWSCMSERDQFDEQAEEQRRIDAERGEHAEGDEP